MSKYRSNYVVLKLIEIGDIFMSPDWCGVHYLWQNYCSVKYNQSGDAEASSVCTIVPSNAPGSCCFELGRFQVCMVLQLAVDSESDRFSACYQLTCIRVYRRQIDC